MFAYVGGYTTADRDGHGNGINACRVDEVSGGWSQLHRVGDLENPALFTLSGDQRRLYFMHGGRSLASLSRSTGKLAG